MTTESTETFLSEDFSFSNDWMNIQKKGVKSNDAGEDALFGTASALLEQITLLLVAVGLVFNCVILRCYWRNRSSTSAYIRALAWYDIASLLSLACKRLLDATFAMCSFPKLSALSSQYSGACTWWGRSSWLSIASWWSRFPSSSSCTRRRCAE